MNPGKRGTPNTWSGTQWSYPGTTLEMCSGKAPHRDLTFQVNNVNFLLINDNETFAMSSQYSLRLEFSGVMKYKIHIEINVIARVTDMNEKAYP